MNSLSFTGRLTDNADLRTVSGDTEVCSFIVANNVGFGEYAKVNWIKCNLWGKRGKSLSPYLVKGVQVGIVGEVSLNTYKNRSGESRTEMLVHVNDITLLGSSKDRHPEQNDEEQPEIVF